MALPIRVHFKTTGCKVNQADTETVRAALADLPVRFVGPEEPADLVVVNACAVTGAAERDGRAAVNRATRAGTRVILAGCMATRLETQGDRTGVPGTARVVGGTRDRARLILELRAAILEAAGAGAGESQGGGCAPALHGRDGGSRGGGGAPALHGGDGGPAVEGPPDGPDDDPGLGRARPLLKVQDGCDCRCSYCIVPHLRGPSHSTPLADVLAAFRAVVAPPTGETPPSEVVLAGVDLAAWGRDLPGAPDLADLLDALTGLGTGVRLRLSSVEPHGLTGRLLDRLAGPDLCPHLHVPLQSGADPVLAAMNRPYRSAWFADRIREAAACVPGLSLGFDVIVGFPGETGGDHDATCALLESLPATYLHVFSYSPRPGTPAAGFPGEVPPPIKADRSAQLRALSARRKAERAAAWVGRTVEVVDIRCRAGFVESLAADYTRIRRPGATTRPGRFAVRIVAADGALCLAEDR